MPSSPASSRARAGTVLSAWGRQAAAASWPLPFRIYDLGMASVTLKGARSDCAPQLGSMDTVDMDQEVIRRHLERRPACTTVTSTNMDTSQAGVSWVHNPDRTITTRFKQHLRCNSRAGIEHFTEDVPFTVGFYGLPRSDSGASGIDSPPSHLTLTLFDRINMDTDGPCTATTRLALFYGRNSDIDGRCVTILDSLCSVALTRILMVLWTAILDSLWSMDYTRWCSVQLI